MLAKYCGLSTLVLVSIGCLASAAEIKGVITRFDPDKKELVVEGRGRAGRGVTVNLLVTEDTQLRHGRKSVELSSLEPGRRVRIYFEARDGKRVALSIDVHGSSQASPLPAAPTDDKTITGSLIRIGLTDREIVVLSSGAEKGAEKETTLTVPENTRITKDQKPLKLDDLKEGERVVVRFDRRDGKMIATSIQIGAAGPMPTENRIERIRRFLKLADELLRMAEERREGAPR